VAGSVDIEVPRWLGTAGMQVKVEEVGVADLSAVGWGTRGDVFRNPLALPYLATRSRYDQPNLVLLFRTPQRLPAGASGRIGSRQGLVDGLTLRAADPAGAAAALTEGGAIGVGDPSLFLRQHREVVDDPAERAALLHGDSSGSRLRQGSTLLFYVALFLVTWLLASDDQPSILWVAPTVALVVAAALRWLANRSSG
jgi:hypothetical protein